MINRRVNILPINKSSKTFKIRTGSSKGARPEATRVSEAESSASGTDFSREELMGFLYCVQASCRILKVLHVWSISEGFASSTLSFYLSILMTYIRSTERLLPLEELWFFPGFCGVILNFSFPIVNTAVREEIWNSFIRNQNKRAFHTIEIGLILQFAPSTKFQWVFQLKCWLNQLQ